MQENNFSCTFLLTCIKFTLKLTRFHFDTIFLRSFMQPNTHNPVVGDTSLNLDLGERENIINMTPLGHDCYIFFVNNCPKKE